MHRFLFLFILGTILSGSVTAQDLTATIKGKVIDRDTRQPLMGVNVLVVNSNPVQGASTDDKGLFKISKLKVGRHTLKLTYIGYENAVVTEVLVSSGKEVFLNIDMQEKITDMREVVVSGQKDKSKANNEFASVSARSFSAEEMSRYAATQNDPARVVQSFAGVMTASDDNNQIVVRGNSPRGLLWRMEGIEIPNPNHFAGSEGSTGGGVSILSANMLTNTDFYSGAFPAEFGDALSGVFDLNLRKGNTDKHEFAVQAGVLGLEAALEGPFSKKYKGSYLINYRYSTLEILGLIGLKIGGTVLPKYQDLSFNFYFPTAKAGSFTLFGVGGMSSLGQKAVHDISKWQVLSDKSEFTLKQMVGVVGATHLYLINSKTYVKTVASYSYTNNKSSDDTLSNDFMPFTIDDEKFIYKTFRITSMINHKLDTKNVLRAGIIYSNIDYQLFSEAFSYPSLQMQTQVNNLGNTSLAQAYVQWKHRFTERVQLNSGVHFTYSLVNDKFYIEPRLGGDWRIKENQTLSFGAGLHSRIDAMSTYYSYINPDVTGPKYPNQKLDFSRAIHAVLGYNFNFIKDFRLKVEAYAQYLFSVPIGADSANRSYSLLNYNDGFVNMPLKSTGTGYNYGVEITLEKFFSHHYFFMYTASFYQSKYKAADDIWRSTAYNVHYVMNLLGGKEFVVGKKKNDIIGANIKFIWRGGQKYTPVDLSASIAAHETVYQSNAAYSQKLPDYVRMDFGLYFRRNLKKYSWTLSFDAQNIINRQNVADVVYNPDTQTIKTEKNLGIVPVLAWKIEFGIKPKGSE